MEFVLTICSFLEENRNTDLIRWSDKGDSFIVVDEDEFARTLIPELFKHKNYASFVRQLNMYGFHKKVGLSDNSMRASERKDKSPSEYYHPYFQRGRSNLLWLIQKPKNPQGKGSGKGAKSRQEDGTLDDEGEEVYDVDSPAPGPRGHQNSTPQRNGRQPLMIGQGYGENSDGMTPSQDQMAAIHQELASVRKNQKMISEVLQQMARENERQAQAYKTLHDRHESSINAILTFLATVYNRSLAEGQAAPNFGSVLAGAFPQNTEAQGNVVDMGDYNEQNSTPTQAQPLFKRQPLLLKAPPTGDQSTASTTTAHPSSRLSPNTAQQNLFSTSSTQSPAVQELFSPVASNRSSQSPRMPPSNSAASPDQLPEADIMSMINSHNAQNSFTPGTRMNFPEALSHLQNADGKTPLTPNQRNNVLQLMAGSSADNGTNNNNAMTSPNPPTIPETSQFDVTRDQLTFLGNAIKDQEQKVENLQQSLAPLSPSGSIPGIGADGQYNTDLLDIDSIFNSGDYFTEHAPEIDFANGGDIPDFDFSTGLPEDAGDTNDDATMRNDVGLDGVRDGRSERGSEIETLGSSEAPSPAVTVEDVPEEAEEVGRKRRRKN